MMTSADYHLLKKFSSLWKIFHQFILGHPNIILALPNAILVGRNHLGLKEEPLTKGEESNKRFKKHVQTQVSPIFNTSIRS